MPSVLVVQVVVSKAVSVDVTVVDTIQSMDLAERTVQVVTTAHPSVRWP